MQNLLSTMLGTHVAILQVNSDQVSGLLVNVQPDYVTVMAEDGQPTYLQQRHIASVTTNLTELALPMDEIMMDFPPSFTLLLRSLEKQMVQIGIGNRSIVGLLNYMDDQDVSLISSMKQMIHLPISQVQRLLPESGSGEKDDEKKNSNAASGSSQGSKMSDNKVSEEETSTSTDIVASGVSNHDLTVFNSSREDTKKQNTDKGPVQLEDSGGHSKVWRPISGIGSGKTLRLRYIQGAGRLKQKSKMKVKPRNGDKGSQKDARTMRSAKLTLFDSSLKRSGHGRHVSQRKYS
jgi:hypothetical protein